MLAARAAFEETGFARAIVADIVRRAGVAHGTFYVHFDDLAAVADAILVEENVQLAERLVPALAQAGTEPRRRTVQRVARVFLDWLEHDRAFVRWYAERFAAGLPSTSLTDGINPPALAALTRALGAEASRLSPQRLSLAAHGLLACWLRVGVRYALSEPPGRPSRKDAEAVLVELTTGALAALVPEATNPNPKARA